MAQLGPILAIRAESPLKIPFKPSFSQTRFKIPKVVIDREEDGERLQEEEEENGKSEELKEGGRRYCSLEGVVAEEDKEEIEEEGGEEGEIVLDE